MHHLMRTTVQVCAAVGLALLTVACGGTKGASSTASSSAVSSSAVSSSAASSSAASSSMATSVTPTTAATPRRDLTQQGFIAKDVGQLAGIDCTGDLNTCSVKFSVDKIEVNPQCHQYGAPPAAGRKTLLLHVSMTTGDLSQDGSRMAPSIFNPFSLNGIADDGFVQEGKPGTCTDQDKRLSNTILPNSRYAGTVEVEVAEAATSVASAYPVASDGSRGWVWKIG